MSERNRQMVLRERPTGEVSGEHFELIESDVPVAGDGEVLLRTTWLSFDPAQRGWLNDVRSYVPPVA
ncbi:MAG: NADP-dependent oxidoreductase, partial [Ilumatobacteraceae bacterium]